jgi:hypothetical protein
VLVRGKCTGRGERNKMGKRQRGEGQREKDRVKEM